MLTFAVALLTTALVLVVALLAAVGTGKLARMDSATYPAALARAATAFASVITLAATVTAALAALSTLRDCGSPHCASRARFGALCRIFRPSVACAPTSSSPRFSSLAAARPDPSPRCLPPNRTAIARPVQRAARPQRPDRIGVLAWPRLSQGVGIAKSTHIG
ncbi:hypothetical protein PYK79_03575 [Streptomyces sp. ID05-04B]|nr:hypothetical protein [Streptomyces sp. ID05-04B]MDX5562781.1 hypothetical protein [Streptomyces sp. ID05-04B]